MEAEQQHCDWFVEKRLMEERMNSLMSEIKERDAMEDKMEVCAVPSCCCCFVVQADTMHVCLTDVRPLFV